MSNENNNQNINSKDFIIGALVGGIVGAASALLMAPKSGKELRSDINEQAGTIKDKGSEWSAMAKDKSSNIARTVSEQSNQVAGKVKELTTSIRRDLDNWRNKGKEVADESADAYGEITSQVEAEANRQPEEELVEHKY
ncbi:MULTISPECIES: YtxH domain-containing protein [Fictibacillus]|uniref:YtxH domain-containing protein n=1 Tax=Fictibacillus terranigra TaxID=3058424 RepID=A0ABT8E3U5_9BACL|nr:YtxH domain-containing protein [Fictibacillus sp. CENA-BCM004]MDN4072574.1 YtxH domain-containing protein [Fictibacillus sp. CENA-BCM004]